MKSEKMDLTKFEAMEETTQGALIGGFSVAVTAKEIATANMNGNCGGCNGNCPCILD